MKRWTADFETTTDINDCRVWAYGLCEIGNTDNFIYGNNIDDFLKWCEQEDNPILYFHNLKFDQSFIISRLFELGFKWSKFKKTRSFNTMVNAMGVVYQLEIIFKKYNKKFKKVTIYDSYKKLPFKVKDIAKAFGLPIGKLEIDYTMYRAKNYVLSEEEIQYLKHDVEIVARALKIQFDEGMDRMTIGADAMFDYKTRIGSGEFKHTFPVFDLEKDEELRRTYRGGFTYLNPKYKGVDVKDGLCYDVNSLYPYVMRERFLPIGNGVKFFGKYEYDSEYPLYTQKIITKFRVKKDHIPTIQIKKNLKFKATEYIETTGEEEVTLYLTNVDLDLFLDHYIVDYIEYIDGYKFKGAYHLFDDYIDYWAKVKMDNNDNPGLRTLAKLKLNNLYGKFGTNPDVTCKIPYLNDEAIVKYKKGDDEMRKPVYVVMASFITAYARELTIRTAQSLYSRFIYSDTDSIHIEGLEVPNIPIDDLKFGYFKEEYKFRKGRFLKSKTYLEDVYNKKSDSYEFKVVCAGMQEKSKELVNFDNFYIGNHFEGTLDPVAVRGGIVLVDTGHTIT